LSPSLRLNQFGLALTLGIIGEMLSYDFARSAELLAFLCSLGLIVAGVLLVYVVGGGKYELVAAAAILSTSTPIVTNTLRAESESPFLVFTVLAVAFFLLGWKHRSWLALILGALSLLLALSFRGIAAFHALSVGLVVSVAVFFAPKGERTGPRRIGATWLGLLASFLVFSFSRQIVVHRVARAYQLRDGHSPFIRSYATWVVYDGLVSGPYGVHSREAWAKRQEVWKGIDPATGKRRPNPVSEGQSAFSVIWQHRQEYADNYLHGVWITLEKFVCDSAFNIVGFWPLVLGILILTGRRNWLALAVATSWVGIYLFIVPGVFAHNRSVWPASLGLLLPGVFFFGFLARSALSCGSSESHPVLQWILSALLGLLLVSAAKQVLQAGQERSVDVRLAAREQIVDVPDHTLKVMSSEAGIATYGEPLYFIQMPWGEAEQVQREYLLSTTPDYIFFFGPYRTIWSDTYEALKIVLETPSPDFLAVRVWAEGNSELWRFAYYD
jgi:hypothetical protein